MAQSWQVHAGEEWRTRPHAREIEQLSRSGIEIPLDRCASWTMGLLRIRTRGCILYIRDVAQYRNSGTRENELPRFHVSIARSFKRCVRTSDSKVCRGNGGKMGWFELNVTRWREQASRADALSSFASASFA